MSDEKHYPNIAICEPDIRDEIIERQRRQIRELTDQLRGRRLADGSLIAEGSKRRDN
jgi:hypothetical protein